MPLNDLFGLIKPKERKLVKVVTVRWVSHPTLWGGKELCPSMNRPVRIGKMLVNDVLNLTRTVDLGGVQAVVKDSIFITDVTEMYEDEVPCGFVNENEEAYVPIPRRILED
jgi:hypothetical protein